MSNLQQAISSETVDVLKKRYVTFFGIRPKKTLKAWLTEALTEGLSDTNMLKAYLQTLSDLERLFIRECIFNYNDRIDKSRFETKYGDFPSQPEIGRGFNSYRNQLSESLEVFFYPPEFERYGQYQIPGALSSLLKQLIDKPELYTLKISTLPEPLPEHHKLFEREQLAESELHSLLILLQNKQIKVSEKTGVASAATLSNVSKEVHEYYEKPSSRDATGMESIASYGWLRLLGNCKFSKQSKSTLIPAKKTHKHSGDTIKDIWDHWMTNRSDDEFRRIDNIKGQTGKGKRFFTNVVTRRQPVVAALKECTVNEWVAFEDFSSFMFITGSELEVTSNAGYLYVYGPEFGEYYDPSWDSLEARYVLCFLVEYAATLGVIDVIMAPPNSDEPYYDGIGDMECLSRYDGLRFFRLTSLGEYVLGMTDHYQSKEPATSETTLTIHRRGRIVFANSPTPWEQRFLSLYADEDNENDWQLSRRKIMETQQIGGSVTELKQFLLARETQPFLPEDCEGILKQAEANLDGAKIQNEALIITCKNQEIADFIINDKVLSKWCQRLDKLQVVIPKNKEKQFRDNLNAAGIGCT